MKNHWDLLLIVLLFISCDFFFPAKIEEPHPIPLPPANQLTDTRDGQVYKTIELDGNTWMAENLNIKTLDSWCYSNLAANCNAMGRLYTWQAALSACPEGWRIPNNEEWKSLLKSFGGYLWPMKTFTEGDPDLAYQNAVNDFKFTLAGARLPETPGEYTGIGESTSFWSSDEMDEESAHNVTFTGKVGHQQAVFDGTLMYIKSGGYSCRCIQD